MGPVMMVYKRMASSRASGNQPRGGQIAIISSIVGIFDPPQMCYNNACNAALVSFAHDLRYLGRQNNISVSLVTPGCLATHMAERTKGNKQCLSLSPIITASADKLAKSIQTLLYKDEPQVAYPFFESLPSWAGSVLPPRVADTASWMVGKTWSIFSRTGDQDGRKGLGHIPTDRRAGYSLSSKSS
jgi:short-subunit dehydrogenase